MTGVGCTEKAPRKHGGHGVLFYKYLRDLRVSIDFVSSRFLGRLKADARPVGAGDDGQRQHAEDDEQQDAAAAAGARSAAAEAEVSLQPAE